MTGEQAYQILGPHLKRLALAIDKSFDTYRNRYPHRPIHRRTTAANVICDEAWAELVNEFVDDAPLIRPIDQNRGLRLFGVTGRTGEIEILLWLKKVNGQKKPRCYPTKRAKERLAGRNLEMFGQATILVVGYQLSRDETRLLRVSIFRPSLAKPEWYIDLELPEKDSKLVRMSGASDSNRNDARRVVVRRIKQTRLGE